MYLAFLMRQSLDGSGTIDAKGNSFFVVLGGFPALNLRSQIAAVAGP